MLAQSCASVPPEPAYRVDFKHGFSVFLMFDGTGNLTHKFTRNWRQIVALRQRADAGAA